MAFTPIAASSSATPSSSCGVNFQHSRTSGICARASGRDTGDRMKLSRDKVGETSHKVVEMLRKNRDLRLKTRIRTPSAWRLSAS
jgi:hypothetical protein